MASPNFVMAVRGIKGSSSLVKILACCSSSNGMKGTVFNFFIMMLFSPMLSMQGCNNLSFLQTKKNPAPTGEDESQIIPASSEFLMYSCMAEVSDGDKEYNRPLGGEVPDNRSIAQSCG